VKTPKINREEVRENSLTVPMRKEEKEEIQKAADKMGLSMSAFARMAFKDFMRKEVQ
jgi:antitoxin component of RelBE/YafQ-DinJ toxin-antitoxin module